VGTDPYAFYTHHLNGVANLHQGLIAILFTERLVEIPAASGQNLR
jgi:hypothetical protein